MNLADMLTYADIGQLHDIAGRYRCECGRNSKHDLIKNILITLGSQTYIEQLLDECPEQDLRFINLLLFDSRAFFSLEDLLALARQASIEKEQTPGAPAGMRETVARFRRSGWLFNGTTHGTRYQFRIPADLKERFRIALDRKIRGVVRPGTEPYAYRSEEGLLLTDLHILLQFIRDNEPELNQAGAIHKRGQLALMNAFNVPETPLDKGGWRFGYGRAFEHYPARLALLYDYARHRRWISEEGFRLTLTHTGAGAAENGPDADLMQLFGFWLRLYKGAVPNLPSLAYWTGVCAKDWITVSSLLEASVWLVKPFYYDDAQTILEQRMLPMLSHFGLLNFGESAEGSVIKVSARGAESLRLKQLLS